MNMKKQNQRKLQAQKRRKEILDAAKKLFAQNGYHATTTRSINNEIGMADGLMYHYFPGGKMEILETIVQKEIERKRRSVERTPKSIEEAGNLEELLYEIGRIILETATKDREMMVIALREYHILKEKFSEPVGEFLGFYDYLAQQLQQYMDKGEIKKLDPKFTAIQFISPFSLYTMSKLVTGDSGSSYFGTDDDVFLKRTVENMLKLLEI